MRFTIKPIAAQDTLPLRQRVLWPDYPIEVSMLKEDDSGFHFGGALGDELVCVASLFHEGDSIRLRKFATHPDHQGRGFGTQMLERLWAEAKAKGATLFWFDAREDALPFYRRNGYTAKGARFYKKNVAYRRVERDLR